MSKDYKYILFDLDGTLTDPKEGITKSFQYALKHFGIEEDLANLEKFIGPPLHDSFRDDYNFSEEEVEEAVTKFREYFAQNGIFENKIFSGVKEVLEYLHSNNKRILLATSKPTIFAEKILKHFEIDKYFEYIGGSNLDGSRSEKNEVINHVLEVCKVSSMEDVIMIGDRKYDVIGAKKIGVDSIGVLYGYGDLEELQEVNPTYIIKNIEELKNIL
ncbi:HAD family hydrolase [Romboutsia sp. CE17]|uniref:HAD family hydrolase n=1 Tax=Romboutsia sp. CE17 TaxID=2724150 RepID=UPI001442BF40|nr:HAD family hydrolase [Romboutsia sp. CE17]QJA09760.1 HAD family hydrolase [Romboutsia sp. CE17]